MSKTTVVEGNEPKESNSPKGDHDSKLQGRRVAIDWKPIDVDISNGMTFEEAERVHGVSHWTIRKHAKRKGITIMPSKLKEIVQRGVQKQLEKVSSEITAAEIEKHKRTVFDITSSSVKKFKSKAPRSFRELDTADKMARRAAGIEDDEGGNKLMLVQLNEMIEDHDPQEASASLQQGNTDAPLDAEIVAG